MSQTFMKNTEANADVYGLNQKTKQALESLAFVHSAFEKAGEDLNKEDESYDKVSEGFQTAIGALNDAQQVEEVAHEQLCNSRVRHDKDFLEM